MNPLLKKEIRLLLPAWIAAMVLAVVPSFIVWAALSMNIMQLRQSLEPGSVLASYVPAIFALGLLLLGINSFGQELSSNSFGMMLSQPVDRRRIWSVKIVTLAVAFVSIWLTAMFLVSWQFEVWKSVLTAERLSYTVVEGNRWLPSPAILESFKSSALEFLTLSAFVAFSGGLWATLLLRQTANAFWVALLTPIAIVLGVGTILGFSPMSDQAISIITAVILFCYSIAGFVWARRLFLRAQDAQWTGGNFLFPWRGKSVEQTASLVRLPRNRFLALTWKEIRLHEVNLFIAAVLLAVHLAAVVLHPMVSNRNTKMVLELVWSLWLAMPLLIGCAAVAEERKLGVMDSQLCLPASRHSQFSIKFFVALILSIVLGAVMPSVIQGAQKFGVDAPHYWIYLAAVVIFFISFYASTLARSALHAIGVAIVLPFVIWFGFIAFCLLAFRVEILSPDNDYYSGYENICRGWLMLALCLLVFPLVLARLMFWNFKWLHQGWKVLRFNAAAILITLALLFALTNAIYFRPWELLAPIESPRGPARLSADTSVKLSPVTGWKKMMAILPDGRLWEEKLRFSETDFRSFSLERWSPYLYSQRFIGGSNWTDIASSGLYILSVHQNGTLWCLPQTGNRVRMAQIGSEADWRKVGNISVGFLLLKNDGTLWLWGTNNVSNIQNDYTRLSKKIKLDLAIPPVRIDSGTNWTDIVPIARYRALGEKNDGTFWSWRDKWQGNTNDIWGLFQEKNMDNQWNSYAYNWNSSAEIKTNGELWLFEQPPKNWWGQEDRPDVASYTKKIKLDSDPVWKAVSFADYGDALILLRQDGTLWKWNNLEQKSFRPVRLGHYSDWIALSDDNWMGVALASDGSLWSWSDSSDHIWLAPSRRPVYMGNVLEGEGRKE
jgi:ABC-type transport system involved in multi-copper enzyme maturation permease subunit